MKKSNLSNVALGFSLAALLVALLAAAYKTFTLGSGKEDYETVCIGGHEYWRANFAAKGLLAIKLNNRGMPITCLSK